MNIRIPGNSRGIGYVEFLNRQTLINALALDDEVSGIYVNVLEKKCFPTICNYTFFVIFSQCVTGKSELI